MKTVVLARRVAVYWLAMALIIGSFSSIAQAQVTTTSRIIGTVMDPNGAVVGNAEVVIKNDETGVEYKMKVGDDGTFSIASLAVGIYTVSVTAPGFKQTVLSNVKTEIGTPATVNVKLEVGAANETVTVTSGAEVLQRDTTTVGAVISGRAITELPFASRDALDLVMTLPGTSTPGRPRTSSVNGLPKGALNISIDGINVQDNTLRTTDGFFTYIRPRIDAIEEVQVSTATPGAEASAGGAIHIRFVTKGGTNEYHGGAYWYNRQRAYNSNYFFSNLNGVERAQVMLNQFGFKIGGPVTPWLKDKVFFFFNYEEYRLPEQQTRTRTIYTPQADSGVFRYLLADGSIASVNLFQVASTRCPAGAICPTTIDPTIAGILANIRSATSKGSVRDQSDPNLQQLTFTNTGGQTRKFPAIRFDANITSKHHLEAIYNYQDFASTVDFLNSRDPAFPDPVPQILGSQGSDRFSFSTALRSQLSATMVNEARFGLTGGTVVFFPETGPASFAPFGGIAPTFPQTSNPYSGTTNSRRNAPIWQFADNLSWSKGRHNLNFGATYNKGTQFTQDSGGQLVPTISFGLATTDPAINAFTSTTLDPDGSGPIPGPNTSQLGAARTLYAFLAGKVTAVNFNAKLSETTGQYSLNDQAIARNQTSSFGFYFQDYFKVKPNLSLNYGIRWEPQLAPRHTNGVYVRPTAVGLYGPSGVGNLFRPGAIGGSATTYIPISEDTKPFNDDYNNIGPSIGIAWSPSFENSLLKRVFGEGDRSVIRAAYSVSYVTGGFADFTGIWSSNPGLTRIVSARSGQEYTPGTVVLRNGLPPLQAVPSRTFPVASSAGVSANDFDPGLHTPYVQSWSIGWQRELDKDTVFEARYVGNRSIGLTRTVNLNEVNIFENGFLQEFINAQKNLAIAVAAGRPANFSNQGLTGQVALPIMTASFGSATSANFGNATLIDLLRQGQAGSFANTLGNSSGNIAFQNNRIAAGLPANLFTANPSVYGAGSNLQANMDYSTYNGLQVELRRRMTNGLFMSANYTWSHALTDRFFGQPHTLRDPAMDRGPSPWDLRHAFKVNYIYELPFGPGRKFDGGGSVVGKILEGWQTDGIIRWQSGRVFPLTSGRATVNQFESGVELVGMSVADLQKEIKIIKDPLASTRGTVFWLPNDIIDNSLKAFGLRAGTPTGRYIAPPTTPGKFGSYVFLYGPMFFRADLSVMKKTRITERANIEFRFELLNAFNHTNFYLGSPNSDAVSIAVNSLTFGQTNSAYQDVSTTNDPGGRLGQFVLRFNF